MVVCPKCGEDIASLRWQSTRCAGGALTVDDKGDECLEDDCFAYQEAEYTFWCPNCDAELFADIDDAIEFLKGGAAT